MKWFQDVVIMFWQVASYKFGEKLAHINEAEMWELSWQAVKEELKLCVPLGGYYYIVHGIRGPLENQEFPLTGD